MYKQIDSPRADDSPDFRPLAPAVSQNILDIRHILEDSSSSDVVDSPDLTVTFDQPAGRLGRLGPSLSRSSTSLPRALAGVASAGASRSRLNLASGGVGDDSGVESENEEDRESGVGVESASLLKPGKAEQFGGSGSGGVETQELSQTS